MRVFIAALGLTFLFLFSQAQAAESCAVHFPEKETLYFKDLTYQRLTKIEDWELKGVFPDHGPNDVYIGITEGHVYFAIDGYRYDGGMGINGHKAKKRRLDHLSEGVIFRLRNVPQVSINKLVEMFNNPYEKPTSMTCGQGVCNFLNSAGFNISTIQKYSPSLLLNHLAKNGVKLIDGTTLTPEVYLLIESTDANTIPKIVARSRKFEAKLVASNPMLYPNLAVLGYILNRVFFNFN